MIHQKCRGGLTIRWRRLQGFYGTTTAMGGMLAGRRAGDFRRRPRNVTSNAAARSSKMPAKMGAELVVLPENFAFLGEHETAKMAVAENGARRRCHLVDDARRCARDAQHRRWCSAACPKRSAPTHVHNTVVYVDAARRDPRHLSQDPPVRRRDSRRRDLSRVGIGQSRATKPVVVETPSARSA